MDIKQKHKIYNKTAKTWGGPGAPCWDFFGSRLAALAQIYNGANVLDIGCARGASLFPAAEKAGDSGFVTGIELSEEMVRETAADIKNRRLNNVRIFHMDAENMSFDDAEFDFIISGFTLGSFKLNDAVRVLKPGGKAGFSAWGKIDGDLSGLYLKYLPQDFPGWESNTSEKLESLLFNAGLSKIESQYEEMTFLYKNEEAWWEQLKGSTMNRLFFDKIIAGPERSFAEFKDEAFANLQNYKRDDGFHIEMSVYFTFGVK